MKKKKQKSHHYVFKFMFIVLLTLVCMIALKQNASFKKWFNKQVYEKNMNFAYVNTLYKKYFGSSFPFEIKDKSQTVFHENLEYEKANLYLDGVKLTVKDHYLVPILNTGMVVFIGKKEGYGNTVIVEESNGVEVWYGNIKQIDVNIYDLKEKGEYLGEASKEIYLVFKKDGKILNYKDYI